MNLQDLADQYSGAMYGELVLKHCRTNSVDFNVRSLIGTVEGLPEANSPAMKAWVDEYSAMVSNAAFWRRDLGEFFVEVCDRARLWFKNAGITPTDDDVLEMFQVVVMNSVCLVQKARVESFVRESMGGRGGGIGCFVPILLFGAGYSVLSFLA